MAPPKLYCVICGKEATGTAAHVLVCDEHRRMYRSVKTQGML
jgi:hypothetical protein